jgi:predicted dehydrogenase
MRIGVIGTGAIARRHLTALRTLPAQFEIACHLATSLEKANAAAQEWGGAGFTNVDAFLHSGRPDAVFITVPPHQHGPIETNLIERNIPFLVEKPLSADRKTAEAIGARLHGRGLVTAVGYQWRALESLPQIRKLLCERGAHLLSARYLSGTPEKPWWRRQAQSGGQVVEQACHVVDLARHLTGSAEVLAAAPAWMARPQFPDADIAVATAALLRFGAGIPGVLEVSCLAPHLQEANLFILGEGWSATISLAHTIMDKDGERTEVRHSGNPYAVQAQKFLSAVLTNSASDVLCRYEDALETHRLCHEITEWPDHRAA